MKRILYLLIALENPPAPPTLAQSISDYFPILHGRASSRWIIASVFQVIFILRNRKTASPFL